MRRVLIPKPDGGEGELGIPTVADWLIQQALLQVLQPISDPTFSERSYGFRPGRRAQDAVLAAQAYLQAGRRVVVDVDLEKFGSSGLSVGGLGRSERLTRVAHRAGRSVRRKRRPPAAVDNSALWTACSDVRVPMQIAVDAAALLDCRVNSMRPPQPSFA